MTIEIRDASLEARIRKQLQATDSGSVEEVLLRLLVTTSALSSFYENRRTCPQVFLRRCGQASIRAQGA
jgi:hypothetical protein